MQNGKLAKNGNNGYSEQAHRVVFNIFLFNNACIGGGGLHKKCTPEHMIKNKAYTYDGKKLENVVSYSPYDEEYNKSLKEK